MSPRPERIRQRLPLRRRAVWLWVQVGLSIRSIAPARADEPPQVSPVAPARNGPPPEAPESAAEVVVRASRPSREPGGLAVTAAEARKFAGGLGDPTRTVESSPGAGRGGPGGELVFWGSGQEENAVLLDGVPIPFLFHGSSIRGAVPASELGTVRTSPGAFGAAFGRATGGLVHLGLRPLGAGASQALVGGDFLDANLRIEPQIVPRLTAAVNYREGYLGAWLPALLDRNTPNLFNIPTYRDGVARLRVRLDASKSLEFNYVASEDSSQRQNLSIDRSLAVVDSKVRAFERLYAIFQHDAEGKASRVVPFVGTSHERSSTQGQSQGYQLQTQSTVYGVRASKELRLLNGLSLTIGADALGSITRVVRAGTLTLPAREGDASVLGQVPASDESFDRFRAHTFELGLFQEFTWARRGVQVVAGARTTLGFSEGSKIRPDTAGSPASGVTSPFSYLDPRLRAELELGQRLRLSAGFGSYVQAPNPTDLSAVFGNPELGPSRALHATFGISTSLTGVFALELVAFYKHITDIAVRSASNPPAVSRVLESTGQGRAFGVQSLLRLQNAGKWSGFLAWTVARSERQPHPSDAPRRFDFDQPYALNLVVARDVGPWTFSVRLRYASGAPKTPVVSAYQNLSTGRYEPILGLPASTRLSDFLQVDARLERAFRLVHRGTLRVVLEGLNVTAQDNPEDLLYTPTFDAVAVLRGLPPIFNVGLSYEQ